jgi:hypothetical protein
MNLSPQYRIFVGRLIAASKSLFSGGRDITPLGLKIGKKVNVEGTGLDGQQALDFDKGKCYVQITEVVVEMGQANALLAHFAIAHEFGHICMAEIGDAIGTSNLSLDSLKHEVAADLIGTCLLMETGVVPGEIIETLNAFGDFVMDENQHGTHPSRKARVGFIAALISKIRVSRIGQLDAITQVLHEMGSV